MKTFPKPSVPLTSADTRRFAVLFPSLLALVVLWSHYRPLEITADGVTYLQIARNILLGKGLGWQALWAPPLHSILIAGASLLTGKGDLLAAAGLVAPLMFFGLVLVVYFLALEFFDLRTALVASLFTALFPQLIFIAFSPEAEITYTFFLMLSLLLFARSVTRKSTAYAVASGLSFALAWMARSEGLLVMVFVLFCVTGLQGRRFYRSAVFRRCLLTILFFLLAVSPYEVFLHNNYGGLVISPKSSYVMIWMKGPVYHDNHKGETDNDELWGLTPDGAKLRWQEPKGIGYLVDFLMSHPKKSLSVYLQNLVSELPGRIPNNSGMERFPQSYPIYLVLAAALALFGAWGSFAREKRGVLLAPLLIFFVLPVFTGGWWKYLIPYLPLVLVLAAHGFSAGTDWCAEKITSQDAARTGALLLVVTCAVISARFVLALHPFTPGPPAAASEASSADQISRRHLAEEARNAGQWGARRFGPGKNYMASWGKIVYYLDGLWTALPVAGDQELLRYGRRNNVDYVVLVNNGTQSMSEPGPVPGLEFAGRYRSGSDPYSVDFYRLLPR